MPAVIAATAGGEVGDRRVAHPTTVRPEIKTDFFWDRELETEELLNSEIILMQIFFQKEWI